MSAPRTLGRDAALASLGCAALAAASACLDGALEARARIAAHGYDHLGFRVGANALRREALDEQWLGAAWLAIASIGAVVAACAIQRWTERGSAARWGWSSCAAALGALAFSGALQLEKGWLGARDGVLALAGVGVVVWSARVRRARPESDDAALQAASLALAAAWPAALWCSRALVWHPAELQTWLRLGVCLVGAALGRALLAASARSSRVRFASLVLFLPLLAAAPIARVVLERTPRESQRERQLNLIVIGIDTLRADATSIRGVGPKERDTTPRLREFGSRSLVFENAVSQAPWTLPAFASIFTGLYPLEHGAHRITSRLAPRATTLAEILREQGYFTAAVTSHVYLDEKHGLEQGFEAFDSSNALGHKAVTSAAVTERSIAALSARPQRPFFLFAHYFDPHYEYVDHGERDWADWYEGWLREQNDFENLLKIRHLVEAPEIDWLSALYHEEIAHTDAQVGRLLEWVRAQGLEDSTLIVVVADHGEEFAERGNFGHTISLFEEQLAVPLIVRAPGELPASVQTVVETRAIFDTALLQLGVSFAGLRPDADLVSVARRERAAGPQLDSRAFSSVWLDDSKLSWGKRVRAASLREGRWKLIDDVTRGRRALFDLDTDPFERRNVLQDQPAVAQRLEALLEPWIKAQSQLTRPSPRAKLDPALESSLKALGYM